MNLNRRQTPFSESRSGESPLNGKSMHKSKTYAVVTCTFLCPGFSKTLGFFRVQPRERGFLVIAVKRLLLFSVSVV